MSKIYKNTKILNNAKIYFFSTLIFTSLLLMGFSLNASAVDSQNADLIIGQEQSGSNLEVSLCVKAISGKITLANVSNWLQYDKNSLTPGTIIEKGVYGNNTDGYSALKWQKVQGTEDKYTLNLGFNGDSQTPGQSGIQMRSNSPELFGKVGFNIIGNNKTIKLDKSIYYSTENSTVPVSMNIKNVEGDCKTSILPSSNPIEQVTKQSQPNSTNQIQNNLSNNNIVSSKSPLSSENNLQKPNLIQPQSDYESVRTGGLNNNFILAIIFLITSFIYVSFSGNKVKYFKK